MEYLVYGSLCASAACALASSVFLGIARRGRRQEPGAGAGAGAA